MKNELNNIKKAGWTGLGPCMIPVSIECFFRLVVPVVVPNS